MTQPQEERGREDGSQFDPQRLRTLLEMRRSSDDKMIAGVCAGVARHLDIDPVIPRVVLATLTFVGLSGLVLYGAAWLLIPEDGASESVAGKTFNLGENETQFRIVGLIVAAIVAIVSGSSLIGGTAFDTPFPYLGLVALFFVWWFVILPHQRSERRARAAGGPGGTASPAGTTTPSGPAYAPPPAPTTGPEAPPAPRRPNPRHDRGLLTALTLFVAMIGVGSLWLYTTLTGDGAAELPVFTSLVVVLAVLGAGMLVGTFVGNGRPLAPLALVTALVLSVSLALPAASVGQQAPAPSTAAQVDDEYRLGIGQVRLDLTGVADPDSLDGRTITVEEGIGSLEVVVPDDVDVTVDAHARAGRVEVFGKDLRRDYPHVRYTDPVDDGPDIELVLRQVFGEIEVSRG